MTPRLRRISEDCTEISFDIIIERNVATRYMVNLKQIAQAAGTSVTKVSKALNGRYDVSQCEAQRICAIAETMGYKPNRLIKSLKSKRSMLIGCLLHDVTNPFNSSLLGGIEEAAAAIDQAVIVTDLRRDEAHALRRLLEYHPDGLVLSGMPREEEWMKELADYLDAGGYMVFCSSDPFPYHPVINLKLDYSAAARLHVQRLAQAGHTKIAYCGNRAISPNACMRLSGYLQGLADAGLEHNPAFILAGHGWEDNEVGGYNAGLALTKLDPRPTAVVAHNDFMALGIIAALEDNGLSVPYDTSIVGFDGIQNAIFRRPKLTTAAVDMQKMGHEAIRLLKNAIETGSIENSEIPWTYVEGETIGLAP